MKQYAEIETAVMFQCATEPASLQQNVCKNTLFSANHWHRFNFHAEPVRTESDSKIRVIGWVYSHRRVVSSPFGGSFRQKTLTDYKSEMKISFCVYFVSTIKQFIHVTKMNASAFFRFSPCCSLLSLWVENDCKGLFLPDKFL